MKNRAHPSPEEWRPAVGYEGVYEVSDQGRVRAVWLPSKKHPASSDGTLRLSVVSKGYLMVALYRKGKRKEYLVHRLVLEAFTGPFAPGEQTNHISGIKADNRLSNLEKVTQSQNARHAVATGLNLPVQGKANGGAKLTDADVRAIRHEESHLYGTPGATEIARRYGVSRSTIYRIWNRKSWTHI